MSYSPESVHVVPAIAGVEPEPGTIFFSDGQVPPSYVPVWYEVQHPGSSTEKVVVMADAPLSEEAFAATQAVYSSDEAVSEAAEAAIDETGRDALTIDLARDPRIGGPEAMERIALVAAQCMFALANSQE